MERENRLSKIIVLDDDPTGSQTVHSCPLLTRWNRENIARGLDDPSLLLFVLGNTRAWPAEKAAAIYREICRNLAAELASRPGRYIFVSRGDSTLRGHFPLETEILEKELGPFDATFLVPAFFEAGRVTIDGVHYLKESDRLLPVHQSEFARDSIFGFSAPTLAGYMEEKSGGRIPASEVFPFPRGLGEDEIHGRLMNLPRGAFCTVDAECQADLDHFAAAIHRASGVGRRFLFRSSASLITSLAALPPQPVPGPEMARLCPRPGAGFILVGSHVEKTTRQLKRLLQKPGLEGIEIDVERAAEEWGPYGAGIDHHIAALVSKAVTPVLYTSRSERRFPGPEARLAFGEKLGRFLMDRVKQLPDKLRFFISKGGITSNDVLSTGLALEMSRVVGQILPGVTVVTTPEEHRIPDLPVVIFPGNVGDDSALAEAFSILRWVGG